MTRPRLLLAGLTGAIILAVVAWRAWPAARDPEVIWREAQADLAAGQLDRVGSAVGRLSRLRHPTPQDWQLRSQLAAARDEFDEALAALAKIPDETPELGPYARLRAGQIELRLDRLRAAEEQFRRALAADPNLVAARRELLAILNLQGRGQEAEEEYRALARLAPLSPADAWYWASVRDLYNWSEGEIEPMLRRAVEADPADRWSRLGLADSLRRQGKLDEAIAVLEPLPADDPAALNGRARVAVEAGDIAGAEAFLARAPEEDVDANLLRAQMAQRRSGAAAGLPYLEKAEAADPGRGSTTRALGRALQAAGRAEEASVHLDRELLLNELRELLTAVRSPAGEADPDLGPRIAAILESLGRPDVALAWYELALARDPLDRSAQAAVRRLRGETGQGGR